MKKWILASIFFCSFSAFAGVYDQCDFDQLKGDLTANHGVADLDAQGYVIAIQNFLLSLDRTNVTMAIGSDIYQINLPMLRQQMIQGQIPPPRADYIINAIMGIRIISFELRYKPQYPACVGQSSVDPGPGRLVLK